jgi:hypothetical protein
MRSAIRMIASTFGVIMSLAGLEHGVGEILQGSNPPPGILFESWPGSETFALMAGEPAMSVIPNLLVSGVVTVLISVVALIWSLAFLGRKSGGLVLLLLSLLLLLVGGGIAPPLIGMIVGTAATRIHNPLRRWRDREPGSNPPLLAKLWHVFTVAGALGYLALLPGIPIAIRFTELEDPAIVVYLGLFSFVLLLLAIIGGLAWDSYQSGQVEINRMPS